MDKKLTDLQRKFVNNLLSGMSQVDAYEKAGYKARGAAARTNASRLLANVSIKQALTKGRQKAANKAEISQTRILREEARLAFLDPRTLVDTDGKLIDLHKLPEDAARAISGLEVIEHADGKLKFKYRFNDKGRSLERISRHLGMYNDKLNLGFTAETLNAILSGLPEDYARAVREALSRSISKS